MLLKCNGYKAIGLPVDLGLRPCSSLSHFIAAAFSGRDFHPELARALRDALGARFLCGQCKSRRARAAGRGFCGKQLWREFGGRQAAVTRNDYSIIFDIARTDPLQRSVEHLGVDDAMKVWEVATDDEKRKLLPAMFSKAANSESLSPVAARDLLKRLKAERSRLR